MSARPFSFAFTFLALFALTLAFLAAVDALPDSTGQSGAPAQDTNVAQDAAALPSMPEQPVRVTARKINLDASVSNPATTSVDVLDNALLKGAVRYPTSAVLGEEGTVLIFGHSSYLPVVHNQNYKAFDGIQNLKPGDTVSVYSGTLEYRYAVTGVRLANATEDVVELPQSGRHLVLVTCNSFATKSDRFIVNADFAGAYAMP